MSTNLSQWRVKWLEFRSQYEQFALLVSSELRLKCKKAGLYAEISCRTKTVASFLKKLMREQMSDPIDEMHDKAGVRAIVPFLSNLVKVDKIIRESFEVKRFDNKTAALGADRFAYQSWHYDVMLKDPIAEKDEVFKDIWCEIQLRTGCQHVWADMSHRLVYKSEQSIPDDIIRRVHLLNGLLESADREFESIRELILEMPGSWNIQVLTGLEGMYYEICDIPYDRDLSLEIIDTIRPVCSEDPIQVLGQVEAWAGKNRETITQIAEEYFQHQERTILFFQPEGLLLLELLENNRFALREVWEKRFDDEALRQIATVFAMPFD